MNISKRRLPTKLKTSHKKIIEAVDDFFGEGCPPKDRKLKKDICLWLMQRKKGLKLNDEQKDALWHIRNNIGAGTY